jgi:hypothetical protein
VSKQYPEKLRRVKFCDQKSGRIFIFLTNNMELTAEPIFENELQDNFFKVYPNPTTGDFTLEMLEFEDFSAITVKIFTMLGSLISSSNASLFITDHPHVESVEGRQETDYGTNGKDRKTGAGNPGT